MAPLHRVMVCAGDEVMLRFLTPLDTTQERLKSLIRHMLSVRPKCSKSMRLRDHDLRCWHSTVDKYEENQIYLLHVFEELAASIIGDVECLRSEVGREELRERGDLGDYSMIIWVLSGEGWLEENCCLHAEALNIGVEQLSC